MSWYLKVLKQYASLFSGRATRKEYWYFTLFDSIIILSLAVLTGAMTELLDVPEAFVTIILGIPYTLYLFVLLPPRIAVTVRRLHDTNRSGWWSIIKLLDVFTLILGSLILLIFLVQDSQPGRNRFGRNPKEVLD